MFNYVLWYVIFMLSGSKILLKEQYSDSRSHAPALVKWHINFCFSHSIDQLIMEPTRTTEHSKTLVDHILANSTDKAISQGF